MTEDEATKLKRRALLPRWIRAFSWLFLIFLTTPIGAPIIAWLAPESARFDAFGMQYVGSAFAPKAIAIQAVLLLQGVAAFGLLWGRSWGLIAGYLAGGVGLAISLSVMIMSTASDIRLEPFFQVPFLVALFRIRTQWHSAGSGKQVA